MSGDRKSPTTYVAEPVTERPRSAADRFLLFATRFAERLRPRRLGATVRWAVVNRPYEIIGAACLAVPFVAFFLLPWITSNVGTFAGHPRVEEWERDGWKYVDWYQPGEGVPFKRSMTNALGYELSGPFAGTGKPHGHWKITPKLDDLLAGKADIEHRWYWYGEEITEGEWHLRNK